MEPLEHRSPDARKSLLSFSNGSVMYEFADDYVKKHRLEEFRNIWGAFEKASEKNITEHYFMREYVWCVYVAGFSAKVIATKIDALLRAHKIEDDKGNFLPITPETYVTDFTEIYKVFGNKNKAKAVQELRKIISEDSWDLFEHKASSRDPEQYWGLPGIGPTLACHLARNLGNLRVVKPDIHLQRLSDHYGYEDPLDMCRTVAPQQLEGLTDLVLWIAAADNGTKIDDSETKASRKPPAAGNRPKARDKLPHQKQN